MLTTIEYKQNKIKRNITELVGTMILVVIGGGAAIFAPTYLSTDITNGIAALALGLTLTAIYYSFGKISGCHLNPAVTIGMWMAGKFEKTEIPAYITFQLFGALTGSTILYLLTSDINGFDTSTFKGSTFGQNEYKNIDIYTAILSQSVTSFIYMLIFLGATQGSCPRDFNGLCIGFELACISLITIPLTNGSINPATATTQALIVQGEALSQLWLFWLAPIGGAITAGLFFDYLTAQEV